MATVTAPTPPPVAEPRPGFWVRLWRRVQAWPAWLNTGCFLLVLLGVSIFIRTRFIGGQFWMDEALTVGISSHPLAQIPGVLRHDGSPPLFYLLLHGWMVVFGAGEPATHALSLLCALATIPVALWGGWSLFGRRAGLMAAVLFSFSAFLTEYSQETRMYALMGLLGLLATIGYLNGFVYRRRRYLILFSVAQALMLYTHAWGIFYAGGALVALVPIYLASDDRRAIVRDGALAFVGAGALFLPWLPNFLYQAGHTAAPWDSSPRLGLPLQLSRDVLGGDRVTVTLLIASVIGLHEFGRRANRGSRQAAMLWALIALPVATLGLAWLASQFTPAWVSRYFAPTLAPLLLLGAWGCSRARIVGIVAIALAVAFTANPGSFVPAYKSDMRDVGGEMTPLLHRGDLVIVSQPEQVPLVWYYLPPGSRYANTIGPVSDPRYMNWVNALDRLRHTDWRATEQSLLASLKPGQQVLFVRPLTEGVKSWKAPWTVLVRRRSAQWGAILQSDRSLRPVAWAPHNYRGACCVADSAVLYKKVS